MRTQASIRIKNKETLCRRSLQLCGHEDVHVMLSFVGEDTYSKAWS
ncbi:unnamed protein product [Linum tenue]|uniref:Uncharacterized protein n=1 Tax=Linum tenue TaxID=586396 RepID=A0AAV0KH96_9ROSI|nr:unnamed protein product [Linum tenue]